jgi:hypothetical protein
MGEQLGIDGSRFGLKAKREIRAPIELKRLQVIDAIPVFRNKDFNTFRTEERFDFSGLSEFFGHVLCNLAEIFFTGFLVAKFHEV